MSSTKRLPLDSPLWSRLETFGIKPERIPLIIKKLTRDAVNPMDPALDELVAGIFDQYSLTNATYAVLPYLAEIYNRYAKTNPNLFYLAANIAASADVGRIDLPPEVREAFLEVLIDFETMAISKVVTKGQPIRDVYNCCVAAIAFSQHCCGKLLMDALEAEPEGTKHTGLVCPQCQEHLEVILFDEGAVVVELGREARPPKPPKPLAAPTTRFHAERRANNPWQLVGSFLSQGLRAASISETQRLHVELATRLCEESFGAHAVSEDAFSLIGSILLTHGFAPSSRRFFRFWDNVTCTKCASTFVAGKRWWGCADLKPLDHNATKLA
jgi:hypothetical protein